MSECLLDKAKAIVASKDSVSYPSSSAAKYVRSIMKELIEIIESDQQQLMELRTLRKQMNVEPGGSPEVSDTADGMDEIFERYDKPIGAARGD